MADDKENYGNIAFMHNVPRFWHTKNISVLASPDGGLRRDYIYGIVAFATFLLSLFVVWAVLMISFKIRGIKNCGCMAGQLSHKRDDTQNASSCRRYRNVQNGFILAICGIFIGSAMFLRKGLPNLDTATLDIQELNADFRYTILEGRDIASKTNEGIQAMENSMIRISNITELDEYCPSQVGSDEFQIFTYRDVILGNLTEVKSFIDGNDLKKLYSNLDELLDRSYFLDGILDSYESHDWLGKLFSMLIIVLSAFLLMYMVVGRCFDDTNAAEVMISYFVLPFFILALSLGWILTIIFASGSMMNADFCYGDGIKGPEATVRDALRHYGFSDDHIMLQSFLYYSNECTQVNTWEVEVTKCVGNFQHVMSTVDSFLSQGDQVRNACGEKVTPILNMFETLMSNIKDISFAFQRGIDITQCERVMPLYRRIFHGTTCQESLIGLSWSFYALLAISLCGSCLVSVRAALYKIKIINSMKPATSTSGNGSFAERRDDLSKPHPSYSTSDEEFGVERSTLERDEGLSLSPTTIRSNQSTIDSHEIFIDDDVNSFNDELEPLTPSPRESSQGSTIRSSSFFPL